MNELKSLKIIVCENNLKFNFPADFFDLLELGIELYHSSNYRNLDTNKIETTYYQIDPVFIKFAIKNPSIGKFDFENLIEPPFTFQDRDLFSTSFESVFIETSKTELLIKYFKETNNQKKRQTIGEQGRNHLINHKKVLAITIQILTGELKKSGESKYLKNNQLNASAIAKKIQSEMNIWGKSEPNNKYDSKISGPLDHTSTEVLTEIIRSAILYV